MSNSNGFCSVNAAFNLVSPFLNGCGEEDWLKKVRDGSDLRYLFNTLPLISDTLNTLNTKEAVEALTNLLPALPRVQANTQIAAKQNLICENCSEVTICPLTSLNMIGLSIPNLPADKVLKDWMEEKLHTTRNDLEELPNSTCHRCGKARLISTVLETGPGIFIYTSTWPLKRIPPLELRIDGTTFMLISALYHQGSDSDSGGHFATYVVDPADRTKFTLADCLHKSLPDSCKRSVKEWSDRKFTLLAYRTL